jgi:hypothetical protein
MFGRLRFSGRRLRGESHRQRVRCLPQMMERLGQMPRRLGAEGDRVRRLPIHIPNVQVFGVSAHQLRRGRALPAQAARCRGSRGRRFATFCCSRPPVATLPGPTVVVITTVDEPGLGVAAGEPTALAGAERYTARRVAWHGRLIGALRPYGDDGGRSGGRTAGAGRGWDRGAGGGGGGGEGQGARSERRASDCRADAGRWRSRQMHTIGPTDSS